MAAFRKKVGGSVSVTDVLTTTNLAFVAHVLFVNDGTNSVYIVLNQSPLDYHTTASTSDFELKSGESLAIDTLGEFANFLAICSTGETATVRFLGWV